MKSFSELIVFVVNLVAIYLAALVAVRVMGKRALGELSLFDLVIMVGIGEVIVIVGLEQQVPFIKGLIILMLLGGLEFFISLLTFKSKFFARLIEGRPALLIKDGVLLEKNLAREHISQSDLRQELRKQGVSSISKVSKAVLESCGHFSVIVDEDSKTGNLDQEILQELMNLRQEIQQLKAQLNNERNEHDQLNQD